MTRRLIHLSILLFLVTLVLSCSSKKISDENFITYQVELTSQNLDVYWKNENGVLFNTFQAVKNNLDSQHKVLLFAMNGGMFKQDYSPQGLFIQNNKQLAALDTTSGNGNFYLKPNGIFYITSDNKAHICVTEKLDSPNKIRCATQSGPMLIIDGQIHNAFKPESASKFVRNGVGILPDDKVIFVISKKEINFYDFAKYFQDLGCKNALYLDGFVSRVYLPEQHFTQSDGNFGVIIGVTKK